MIMIIIIIIIIIIINKLHLHRVHFRPQRPVVNILGDLLPLHWGGAAHNNLAFRYYQTVL